MTETEDAWVLDATHADEVEDELGVWPFCLIKPEG